MLSMEKKREKKKKKRKREENLRWASVKTPCKKSRSIRLEKRSTRRSRRDRRRTNRRRRETEKKRSTIGLCSEGVIKINMREMKDSFFLDDLIQDFNNACGKQRKRGRKRRGRRRQRKRGLETEDTAVDAWDERSKDEPPLNTFSLDFPHKKRQKKKKKKMKKKLKKRQRKEEEDSPEEGTAEDGRGEGESFTSLFVLREWEEEQEEEEADMIDGKAERLSRLSPFPHGN
ncbi:hypothetical protein CSUI_006048 [Cystoisospora suis]|uniref:Uncharacterized protein n=1 Tax=Cystoisospora suis TaxID=483139 RepID=A0A2C6KT32_9APIC|nr:hypothetical protein CSUI_006048 [Cystoisospora suis]